MKKLQIPAIALGFLLCLSAAALAEEAPTPAVDTSAVETVEAPVPAEPDRCEAENGEAQPLVETPFDDSKQEVCNCLDLCRSDAQCELLYGEGSVCVPVGPCGCRECSALY